MAALNRETATAAVARRLTTSSYSTMVGAMGYPGGKGKCYQRLINLMPPHDVYVETHLGSGAVLRHKRPAVRSIAIDRDPTVIDAWSFNARAAGIELHCMDAVAFLRQYHFQGNELVYADPPYVHSTRRRSRIYRFEYTDADHRSLLEVLRAVPARVVLSGYASELYEEALCGWRRVSFCAMTHAGVREECVWMNFEEPDRLHDPRWIGSDFRARQAVGRRRERWLRRFDALDPPERSALLRELGERYGAGEGV